MFRKITGDAFVYSILPQLPRLLNIVLLPFTTPYLSTLDFAIFGTVMAYVAGFELLKGLGLDVILLNSFFQKPTEYKIIWGKIQSIISISSVILSVLIGLILYYILPDELTQYAKIRVVVITSIPSMAFAGLGKIGVLYYQYNNKPFPIVVRSILIGTLAVILNYYSIVSLRLGYMGWFYSGVVTGLLLPISYIYPIWIKEKIRPVYAIAWTEIRKMLSVSLPLLPHYYSNYFLNYSDRILLNLYHTPNAQVGLYNLGYSVSGNFRYVTTSIDRVIGPVFHRELRDKHQDANAIEQIVNVLAMGYLAIGFLGGLWMREVFHILIKNPGLVSSYTIAIIILFSFATRPLYNGAQSFLFYNEKTKNLWKVTFMSGVLNIVLNIIFIPMFGVMAAAVNTLVCIAASHYGVFLLKDFRELTTVDFKPIRWILVTAIVFSTAWMLRDSSVLVKVALTVCLAMAACFFYVSFKRRKRSEASVLRT